VALADAERQDQAGLRVQPGRLVEQAELAELELVRPELPVQRVQSAGQEELVREVLPDQRAGQEAQGALAERAVPEALAQREQQAQPDASDRRARPVLLGLARPEQLDQLALRAALELRGLEKPEPRDQPARKVKRVRQVQQEPLELA